MQRQKSAFENEQEERSIQKKRLYEENQERITAIHSVKEETKKIINEREELLRKEKDKYNLSLLESSKIVNKRFDTYVTETKKIYKASYGKEDMTKESILFNDDQMFED